MASTKRKHICTSASPAFDNPISCVGREYSVACLAVQIPASLRQTNREIQIQIQIQPHTDYGRIIYISLLISLRLVTAVPHGTAAAQYVKYSQGNRSLACSYPVFRGSQLRSTLLSVVVPSRMGICQVCDGTMSGAWFPDVRCSELMCIDCSVPPLW